MSTTECATAEIAGAPGESAGEAPGLARKPLKAVIVGFAATVTIGLALASWYVGERIAAADEAAPASQKAAIRPAVNTLAPRAATMPQAVWYTPPLPPADHYLQVAGLGPKQDAGYVKSLGAKGFRARVGTVAEEGDRRILIGPFASLAKMEKAQHRLQSAGILAVEAVN